MTVSPFSQLVPWSVGDIDGDVTRDNIESDDKKRSWTMPTIATRVPDKSADPAQEIRDRWRGAASHPSFNSGENRQLGSLCFPSIPPTTACSTSLWRRCHSSFAERVDPSSGGLADRHQSETRLRWQLTSRITGTGELARRRIARARPACGGPEGSGSSDWSTTCSGPRRRGLLLLKGLSMASSRAPLAMVRVRTRDTSHGRRLGQGGRGVRPGVLTSPVRTKLLQRQYVPHCSRSAQPVHASGMTRS